MLLTVKKQIEETLEVKTPCYYKTITGFHYINEAGQVVSVNSRMISMWHADDGKWRNDDIQRLVNDGQSCEKEEFEKAYIEASTSMNAAIGLTTVNS
jgi:hypothetical protein